MFFILYMSKICWALIELCHITLSVAFLFRVISNQCHDVSFLTCQTKLLRKRPQEYGITMWVYLSSIFVHFIYKWKSHRYIAMFMIRNRYVFLSLYPLGCKNERNKAKWMDNNKWCVKRIWTYTGSDVLVTQGNCVTIFT